MPNSTEKNDTDKKDTDKNSTHVRSAEINIDDVPVFASPDDSSSAKGSIRCPKCAATKVAKSRAQSMDGLFMRFFPKRPYRCLHCYHRFWQKEPFFTDSRRIWNWALLLLVTLLLLVLLSASIGSYSSTDSAQNLYSETQSQRNPINTIGIDEVEKKLVSKQQEFSDTSVPAPIKGLSKAQQRKIVESLGFKTPDKPIIEGQPISKAELERRLAEAKVKAKTAERINQKKQEDLAQRVNGDSAEMRSLLRIEINFLIEQWQQAWQDGDADRYLSFYSDQFTPAGGRSYESWQTLRRNRVNPSKQIKLSFDNFDVKFNQQNNKCTVTFDQDYKSGTYQDQTRKQLTLLKQQEWKIISEKEIKPS